jgi:O-acetyl-ADP-ribose deacetylase (regulator of RNase III)
MTITNITGNILDSKDELVAHCCNTRNTMNSGVAKALRMQYPEVYGEDTRAYITHGKELLGKSIIVEVSDKTSPIKYVSNLYGQPNYGYEGARYMNYEAFYQSLEELRKQVLELKLTSISMPYKIASDRAGGHWPIVLEMIKHVFNKLPININLYALPDNGS